MLLERSQSAIHQLSKPIFKTRSMPLDLYLNAGQLLPHPFQLMFQSSHQPSLALSEFLCVKDRLFIIEVGSVVLYTRRLKSSMMGDDRSW